MFQVYQLNVIIFMHFNILNILLASPQQEYRHKKANVVIDL